MQLIRDKYLDDLHDQLIELKEAQEEGNEL